MKRSTKFIVGFIAAAVTYGSLFAFVGPRHFGNRGFYPYSAYGYGSERHYRCDDTRRGGWDRDRQSDTPRQRNDAPTDTAGTTPQ